MPELNDLYEYGVVCRIRQLVRQPGGKLCKVMAEGIYRGRISSISSEQPYFFGDVESAPDKAEKVAADRKEALMRTTVGLFDEYVQLSGSMPPEMLLNLVVSRDPAFVAYYTAQNVRLDYRQKQALLEELHPCRRLEMLIELLNHELNVMSIEQELSEATNEQVNRSQRDYYLREQMKIIQQELGEDDTSDDIGEYRQKIRDLKLSQEIEDKLLKEVSHLAKQPFGSTEATVIRGYLDVCLELPWNIKTEETRDIDKARRVLDEDHYGLEKVKQRVIEYLAVRQLAPKAGGSLLCLVGPPGTGKTSIAMSIARATNRKAIQFLLGSNMSEVISIFAATLMGFTILKPVHLLWINLVTDCFPALALGMEKAEGDIMRRKPRPAKDGIFAGGMGFDISYQGVLISALVLAAYFVGHYIETGVWTITDSADGTTMAFLTMSMAEICHSFNMRSLRGCIFTMGTKNKALTWAAIGSIAATTLVCEVPFLADAFGFTPVSLVEYVIAMGIGMVGMVIVELVKVFQRKAMRRRGEIL